MKLDFATVLSDAWTLFKRDRDLLLRIAAPFLFLPAFALALVVPDPPMPVAGAGDNEAQAMAWADAVPGLRLCEGPRRFRWARWSWGLSYHSDLE